MQQAKTFPVTLVFPAAALVTPTERLEPDLLRFLVPDAVVYIL